MARKFTLGSEPLGLQKLFYFAVFSAPPRILGSLLLVGRESVFGKTIALSPF
ncbi:hypothetical protein Pan14r_37540 [Crateriforma conspicua]|uniref:Uncharacterized protein n=1 Tax=Crateriforma conspicua TaxID=2527996 RepID=A0A5C5Y8C5_9PLAN|nr:hypothetical protein Pan14r_37540 [Crateriforma conspicua]